MLGERLRERLGGVATRAPTALGDTAFELRVCSQSGLIRPSRPDKLARVAGRYLRWGASPALGSAANAITAPERTAIIDEAGALTWGGSPPRAHALGRAHR